MIAGTTPWIQGVIKSKYCQNQLKNYSSDELLGLIKKLIKENKDKEFDRFSLVTFDAEDDLFITAGAFDELQERHGREKALNMLGYRKPRTINERLNYFFKGGLPRYGEVA